MNFIMLVACVATLLLAGCSRSSSNQKQESGMLVQPAIRRTSGVVKLATNSPQLSRIRVESVAIAAVPVDEVIAPGKVEMNPSRVTRIAMPVPGRVQRVLVGLGDAVRLGQPLVTIESSEVSSVLSSLRQAQANLAQGNAALTKAEMDLNRARDLLVNRAIAQKEVLNAETLVAQAQAVVEQAQAARDEAQRHLQILGLRPGQKDQEITLSANGPGKVVEISVAPGEYRNDTSAPLITIADLSTVWVAADVPENAIRFVRIGERVNIQLAAYPGETFQGRVMRIADVVDSESRTIKVRAELDNRSGRFRPQMFAQIRHDHGSRSLPMVPKGAVLQQEGQNIVYIERAPGEFHEVPVTIIWQGMDRLAIASGISAGERIVVDGAMLLKGAAL
jgi:cobalt-zinc-cadmium efflux system membrane fusion protein